MFKHMNKRTFKMTFVAAGVIALGMNMLSQQVYAGKRDACGCITNGFGPGAGCNANTNTIDASKLVIDTISKACTLSDLSANTCPTANCNKIPSDNSDDAIQISIINNYDSTHNTMIIKPIYVSCESTIAQNNALLGFYISTKDLKNAMIVPSSYSYSVDTQSNTVKLSLQIENQALNNDNQNLVFKYVTNALPQPTGPLDLKHKSVPLNQASNGALTCVFSDKPFAK